MKKIRIITSIILYLFLLSCSEDVLFDEEIQPKISTEKSTGLKDPIPNLTIGLGFGVFDNEEYDYGWRVGYEDALVHKKSFVQANVSSSCWGVQQTWNSIMNEETNQWTYISVTDVKLYSCSQLNDIQVLARMKNDYGVISYRNYLASRSHLSDFDEGKYAGFILLLHQASYAGF